MKARSLRCRGASISSSTIKRTLDEDLARTVLARFQGAPFELLLQFCFYIVRDGDCWRWVGSHDAEDYGRFYSGKHSYRPYRLTYEWKTNAPFPVGLVPDHLCRNTWCVNPDHIEPVTKRVNVLRGNSPPAYNVLKTHCKQGHPFEESTTYRWKTQRQCRRCHAIRAHQRRIEMRKTTPIKRGSLRADARLTERKVIEIRRRRTMGQSMTSLARDHNVTLGTIRKIVRCETWRHV